MHMSFVINVFQYLNFFNVFSLYVLVLYCYIVLNM